MFFDYELQPGLKKINRNLITDGEPLVTIVTPFFNGMEYFQQTYNCVVNQTFPWFEWIIVNDGSTDVESVSFLEDIASSDPRIIVLHKANGGISSARNFGMRRARTEYVVSLDCDDLIEPQFIEYCWWMLQKNPSASWAYTDSVGFQNQEYLWKKPFDPILLKTENHLTEVAFIRKKAFDEINGYLEITKHYNEDWVFYLRLVATGHFPVQSKNDFLSWYRRRDDGVLSVVRNNDEIRDINRKLIKEYSQNIIDPKPGIIFPFNNFYFDKPRVSDWNKSIFKTHNKIHLLLITAWLEIGGADKFNLDLVSGLDKDLFEVSVITTVPSNEEPWQQHFRSAIFDVFNLPNFMEPKDYAEFLSYFIKSREIDIILISNSYHGYYMMPWLKRNHPQIIFLDYVHMEEMNWRKGGYARVSSVMKLISSRTYVCNSNTKRLMSAHFGHDNVSVMHIGVDTEKFCPDNIQSGITYDKLQIHPSRPIVLFICRLAPQKRPFLMLEIADNVRKMIPNIVFIVVGSGELEANLKERCKAKGLEDTVHFLGSQNEVRPYYKDAKLTLICSIKEGLSLTAYESLSMGVPVVSADVGGQSDLIDDSVGVLIPCNQNEETEYFNTNYSHDEIELYVNSIVSLLSDDNKLKIMSASCRQKILSGFSIKHMIASFSREIINLYQNKQNIYIESEQILSSLETLSIIVDDLLSLEFSEQSVEEGRGYDCFLNNHSSVVSKNDDKFAKDWEWIKWRVGEIDKVITNDKPHEKIADIYKKLSYLESLVNSYQEIIGNHISTLNSQSEMLNRHEEVVNRHEEVVNRHEEVVNRHEEEVNKHNIKIDQNYDAICCLFKELDILKNVKS